MSEEFGSNFERLGSQRKAEPIPSLYHACAFTPEVDSRLRVATKDRSKRELFDDLKEVITSDYKDIPVAITYREESMENGSVGRIIYSFGIEMTAIEVKNTKVEFNKSEFVLGENIHRKATFKERIKILFKGELK